MLVLILKSESRGGFMSVDMVEVLLFNLSTLISVYLVFVIELDCAG